MTGFPKTVPLPTVSSYVVLYPGDESPVWAYPFSLAATRGLDFSSSSSGYLDVSVHRVPTSQREVTVLLLPGFPIRKSAGHWLLAPYRSLSQLIASFFG